MPCEATPFLNLCPETADFCQSFFVCLCLLGFWDCCLLQLHTWDIEGKCQLRDLNIMSFLGVKVSSHSAFLSRPFRIFWGLFLSRVQYFQLYLMEGIDKSTSSVSFWKEAPKFTFNLWTYLEMMYATLFLNVSGIEAITLPSFLPAISMCLFSSIGISSRRKGKELLLSCVECRFHTYVC